MYFNAFSNCRNKTANKKETLCSKSSKIQQRPVPDIPNTRFNGLSLEVEHSTVKLCSKETHDDTYDFIMHHTQQDEQKKSSLGVFDAVSCPEEPIGKCNSYTDLPAYDPVINVTEPAVTTHKTPHTLDTSSCGRFSLKKSTFSSVIRKFNFSTYRNINDTQKLKNTECTSLKSRDTESNSLNNTAKDFSTYDAIKDIVEDLHTKTELPVYDAVQTTKSNLSDVECSNGKHVADESADMPIYDSLQSALAENILEKTLSTQDTCDSSMENELPIYDVLQYCNQNTENEISNDCPQVSELPIYDHVIHDEALHVRDIKQDNVQMIDTPPTLQIKPPNLLKNKMVSSQRKASNIRNVLQSPTSSFLYRSVNK